MRLLRLNPLDLRSELLLFTELPKMWNTNLCFDLIKLFFRSKVDTRDEVNVLTAWARMKYFQGGERVYIWWALNTPLSQLREPNIAAHREHKRVKLCARGSIVGSFLLFRCFLTTHRIAMGIIVHMKLKLWFMSMRDNTRVGEVINWLQRLQSLLSTRLLSVKAKSKHNWTQFLAAFDPRSTTTRTWKSLFLNILVNTWLEWIHHYQLTGRDVLFLWRAMFIHKFMRRNMNHSLLWKRFLRIFRRPIMIPRKVVRNAIKL